MLLKKERHSFSITAVKETEGTFRKKTIEIKRSRSTLASSFSFSVSLMGTHSRKATRAHSKKDQDSKRAELHKAKIPQKPKPDTKRVKQQERGQRKNRKEKESTRNPHFTLLSPLLPLPAPQLPHAVTTLHRQFAPHLHPPPRRARHVVDPERGAARARRRRSGSGSGESGALGACIAEGGQISPNLRLPRHGMVAAAAAATAPDPARTSRPPLTPALDKPNSSVSRRPARSSKPVSSRYLASAASPASSTSSTSSSSSSSSRRSLSAQRVRSSTPPPQHTTSPTPAAAAATVTATTMRSLSVSFQGESFFYQTSRSPRRRTRSLGASTVASTARTPSWLPSNSSADPWRSIPPPPSPPLTRPSPPLPTSLPPPTPTASPPVATRAPVIRRAVASASQQGSGRKPTAAYDGFQRQVCRYSRPQDGDRSRTVKCHRGYLAGHRLQAEEAGGWRAQQKDEARRHHQMGI